jgi:hypothetical protein
LFVSYVNINILIQTFIYLIRFKLSAWIGMLLGAFAAWVFRLGKNQIVTIGIGKKFGQCEVSDQIQNKRSDQIFKS